MPRLSEAPGAPREGSKPGRATRTDVLATLAIIGATAIAVGGPMLARRLSAHPTPEQCAELLERYAEHVAHAVDPKPSASALAERRALARAAASERASLSRCVSDLTLSEVECAMRAGGADELERCLPAR